MSEEKIASLRAFGARVVVCPTAVEPEDPRSYYSVAKKLHRETPNCFYTNQYHNMDNPEGHFKSTGPELWEQTQGEFDVFVAGLGTGGTMTGTGKYLKQKKASIQLVGVDPVGSLYYDFVKDKRMTKPFTYKVEGIGEDFIPSTIDLSVLDDIVRVDDKECFLMARDLVRYEGLYVGGSSGAVVAGAIKYAKARNKKENIVVLLPDGAAKYLSKIFNDEWMKENGFLEQRPKMGQVADLLKGKAKHELITARPHDRVRDVIARLKEHNISQIPVLENGKVIGAVAEVDLLRILFSGEHSLDSEIGPIVEQDYVTVSPDTEIEMLNGLLNQARMAIVKDSNGVVDVITKIDIIDYFSR